MTTVVLAATAVSYAVRRRGRRVPTVERVSLEVVAGEVVALVGTSGAGKTTLLRLLAGQLRPLTGSIRITGRPADTPAARRLVGFAPANPVFPPTITVREALEYYARFHGSTVRRRALVAEALELAGLADVAGRRAAALARSDVQRLALAQATLGGRRVLLLDETLGGVDPSARRLLADRLLALALERGVAVLVATQDPATVERVASRVLLMARGRVVRAGPVAELVGQPVLEVVLDRPPPEPPPGFRLAPFGLETELSAGTVEAALAVCRAYRLAVRATRVRRRSLEDVVLAALGGDAR